MVSGRRGPDAAVGRTDRSGQRAEQFGRWCVDEFERLYNESVRKQDPKVIVEVSRNRGRQTAVLKVTY